MRIRIGGNSFVEWDGASIVIEVGEILGSSEERNTKGEITSRWFAVQDGTLWQQIFIRRNTQ